MTVHELQQEILRLKREKNICILAHAYQSQPVLEVADYTGDSYGLSVQAAKTNADGVIMCGCHPGDCHYVTGNYYTRRRMALLFNFLDYMGIERERMRVEWVSAAEGARFSQVMNDFVGKVTALGENRRIADIRCKDMSESEFIAGGREND